MARPSVPDDDFFFAVPMPGSGEFCTASHFSRGVVSGEVPLMCSTLCNCDQQLHVLLLIGEPGFCALPAFFDRKSWRENYDQRTFR